MATDLAEIIIKIILINDLLSSLIPRGATEIRNQTEENPWELIHDSSSGHDGADLVLRIPSTQNPVMSEADNNATYAYYLPRNRGGKFLNLLLGTDVAKPRIMNKGILNRIRNNHRFPNEYEEDNEDVSCVCVPHYLCKGGELTSGELASTPSNRISRNVDENSQNRVTGLIVVKLYDVRSDKGSCKEGEECCMLPPEDVEIVSPDVSHDVATPIPDDFFTTPQTNLDFPHHSNRRPDDTCGVRFAYGVHGRLVNLKYSPDVVEFGQYPWQVAILQKLSGDQSRYLCGGVLISSQWVATVAHCLRGIDVKKLQARIGEWDVDRKDEIYPHVDATVDSVIVNPEFSPNNLNNDIALVKLSADTDSQYPHITPVCLPDPQRSFIGRRCWVSGWGKDSFGPRGRFQKVLREVDVPILSSERCEAQLRKTRLGRYFTLHPGFICAGGAAGKDACTGDGGSPLVCDFQGIWYVAGLVSWGIGCGQPNVPGVYVNIDYYLEWIKSIVFS